MIYIQIQVACGTFNVNGKEPPETGLDAWLTNFDSETDLVAIGFQELQLDKDAYAGQYMRENSRFLECQERWRLSVTESVKKVNPKLVQSSQPPLQPTSPLLFSYSIYIRWRVALPYGLFDCVPKKCSGSMSISKRAPFLSIAD